MLLQRSGNATCFLGSERDPSGAFTVGESVIYLVRGEMDVVADSKTRWELDARRIRGAKDCGK